MQSVAYRKAWYSLKFVRTLHILEKLRYYKLCCVLKKTLEYKSINKTENLIKMNYRLVLIFNHKYISGNKKGRRTKVSKISHVTS